MAQRRMISLEVVDTDAFLDMPISSQVLYFHLNARADDDGFVANPKKIARMLGTGTDDLKVLMSKKFVIAFEEGVCVIKHWRINNFIRKDIYTETKYIDLKKSLFIRPNGAYTQTDDERAAPLQIEGKGKPNWIEGRKKAREQSSLPYSFDYKIRQAFYGKECPICKIEMKEVPVEEVGYGDKNNPKPTIQHILPISEGGKHELDNIAVICFNCNSSVRNKRTEKLNNNKVKEVWNVIENQSAQKRNAIGTQSAPRVGKGRVGKIRKDKVRLEESKETTKENSLSKKFIKPTLEEVITYCKERDNSINPESFISFYESNGWKVGRNSMKDWKAAVRTWELRDKPVNQKLKSKYAMYD